MIIKVGDIVYVPRLDATGVVFDVMDIMNNKSIVGIDLFIVPKTKPPQRYFHLFHEGLKVLS